jgi:sulfoxide reductase heme-binding subunit YedZ
MTRLDPANYIWWLASRASGVVALVLVTVSVLIGLTMASKLVRRRGVAPVLARVHEHTALAGLIAIAIHGTTLLLDPWLHPTVGGVLVPFTMSYRPVFTGLGIVAGYLAAILGLSFYARKRIGAKLWRKLHRATVAVWLLGVIHTLGAGTDAGTPWMRAFLLVTGVPVVALFALRVLRQVRGPHGWRARAPRVPSGAHGHPDPVRRGRGVDLGPVLEGAGPGGVRAGGGAVGP